MAADGPDREVVTGVVAAEASTTRAVLADVIADEHQNTQEVVKEVVENARDELVGILKPSKEAVAKAVAKTLEQDMKKYHRQATKGVDVARTAKLAVTNARTEAKRVKAQASYESKLEVARSLVAQFIMTFDDDSCTQIHLSLRAHLETAE